ncbi:hypothetical protein T484DRAFT_1880667 [Baffinella frigidus]|nr:hypothetical protein T484DRAFT_1880667 [Cryptophyta sp. CCMP2293]
MGFSLLASQLFMFGNDWADSNNEGMMGNKLTGLSMDLQPHLLTGTFLQLTLLLHLGQVQGLGSTNSEWSNGISDSAETQLQRNV